MALKFPYYCVKEEGIIKVERSLILNEAAKRNIKITPFPLKSNEYFLLEYGTHKEMTGFLNTSSLGLLAGRVTKNKHNTKWLLKKSGISVPNGEVFVKEQKNKILPYVNDKIVVVKPNSGSQGTNVYSGIYKEKVLSVADKIWASGEEYVLIEDYFEGNEYRIFATLQGFIGVSQRIPANVVGNGKSTIEGLILLSVASHRTLHKEILPLPLLCNFLTLNFIQPKHKPPL